MVFFCDIMFMQFGKNCSCGGVAQLGARLNGIQKVEGSIPFVSTKMNRR